MPTALEQDRNSMSFLKGLSLSYVSLPSTYVLG